MHATLSLTSKNLHRLALLNGYRSVEHVAKSINRARVTVYNAVRFPSVYGPTIQLLEKALPNRQARN